MRANTARQAGATTFLALLVTGALVLAGQGALPSLRMPTSPSAGADPYDRVAVPFDLAEFLADAARATQPRRQALVPEITRTALVTATDTTRSTAAPRATTDHLRVSSTPKDSKQRRQLDNRTRGGDRRQPLEPAETTKRRPQAKSTGTRPDRPGRQAAAGGSNRTSTHRGGYRPAKKTQPEAAAMKPAPTMIAAAARPEAKPAKRPAGPGPRTQRADHGRGRGGDKGRKGS